MSHSYKHTPIVGYTYAETEKLDKRIWNSRLRAHERDKLKQIRLYRDYSDQEKIVSRLEQGDEYCECWLCNYGINFYDHDGGDHGHGDDRGHDGDGHGRDRRRPRGNRARSPGCGRGRTRRAPARRPFSPVPHGAAGL